MNEGIHLDLIIIIIHRNCTRRITGPVGLAPNNKLIIIVPVIIIRVITGSSPKFCVLGIYLVILMD